MAFAVVGRVPLTEHVPDLPDAVVLHAHRDEHVWTWAAAIAVAAELRRALQDHARARLLVSGDPMGMPVRRALARAPLDWDRVDVGLTDERWLHPDDPDSRAAAVRRDLLRDRAVGARFETLTAAGRRLEDALACANAHARPGARVALLAMGDDGRIAGLSPGSRDYRQAMDTAQPYAALDASTAPGEAPWARCISITPHGLSRIDTCLLLLRGDVQRRLFEAAASDGSGARHSPLLALRHGGAALQAHWCP